MASIGTTRGTDIPNLDNTLSVADKTVKNTLLSRGFKLTPDSYTTVDDLIKATREDVMPDLVKVYGDQGLTGFLKLTGAVNNGGSSDQIDWWEEGRRHRAYTISDSLSPGGASTMTVSDATFRKEVQKNDVIMDAETGTRFIVKSGGATTSTSSPDNVVLVKMDGTTIANDDVTSSSAKFIVIDFTNKANFIP